jgi:hypothetical protein
MKNVICLLFKLFTYAVLFVEFDLAAYGQIDSLQINKIQGPDDSKTIYPNDGLTYNQYVGETIAGYTLANGWRKDTINGGFNKEIYNNPYVNYEVRLDKQFIDEKLNCYRYKDGKLFTGLVDDYFVVNFTPNKIEGYLNGKPYKLSKSLQVHFQCKCVNGLLQGVGFISGLAYGFVDQVLLSDCTFENGEIVGVCKHNDLNSVEFMIYKDRIQFIQPKFNHTDLMAELATTEYTYSKGSVEWTKKTTKKVNGRTKTEYPKKRKK